MTRITIVTRIRLLAALAPVVLLVAAPYLAGAFYVFGSQLGIVHDRELAALSAARGMEASLYKMEWARTLVDGSQIMFDQSRAFGHWLDLARDRADTPDQRRSIAAIAAQAQSLFPALQGSAPQDEAVSRRARELHARISELVGADDAAILTLADSSRAEARRLIVVTLAAALILPWLCFALLMFVGRRLDARLHAIRQSVERLAEHPAPAAQNELRALDESLTDLGFPKPNPMLAE